MTQTDDSVSAASTPSEVTDQGTVPGPAPDVIPVVPPEPVAPEKRQARATPAHTRKLVLTIGGAIVLLSVVAVLGLVGYRMFSA
jgi:hypothetical protein